MTKCRWNNYPIRNHNPAIHAKGKIATENTINLNSIKLIHFSESSSTLQNTFTLNFIFKNEY